MLESRTDYYVLLSEAFGPSVPSTREARKKIYDGARKALKEQYKLAPHRFDLASEQHALEKAILDVEISAKLGQQIPRWKPGTTPPPARASQLLQAMAPQPAEPAPFSRSVQPPVPDPILSYTPPVQPQPVGPRIEWADPNAIPLEEQGTFLPPPMPVQPAAPLPSSSPVQRKQKTYQPAFLNRPDRVSYMRKADPPPPPPPPPPQPETKKEAPPPPMKRPEQAERPEKPQPSAREEADDTHRLDAGPGKKEPKKSFRPSDTPVAKPRSGFRLFTIIVLAACAGGALAYFTKPEELVRQLMAEFRKFNSASAPTTPKPSPTGASITVGDTPTGTAQDFVQLAIVQTGRREYSQALTTLERAEKMGAGGGEFFQARAYANWGAGNLDRAIADYAEAIRIDPGNATNFANRAVAYNARGEYTLAIRDLERAIAIDPGNPDHWNSRCWARALAGQTQEAVLDCNESLRLRPNDPNTLDSRGFAYLKAGQNARAIADYNAVLAIAPNTASSLYGRGLARMRAGDRPNGNKDIDEAKTITPNIETLFTQYGVR